MALVRFLPDYRINLAMTFRGTARIETGEAADKAIEELMPSFMSKSESMPAALLSSQSDRRAFSRFQCKGTAAVRILPTGPDVLGVIVDISARGCGIEIGIALPAAVGDKVRMDLHINGLSLAPVGIIRSIRQIRSVEKETHVGIEFTQEFERYAELMIQR